MDDNRNEKPFEEYCEEKENSPIDNDVYENAFQDQSAESGSHRNPTSLRQSVARELETSDEKGGTGGNESDSSTRTSKPNENLNLKTSGNRAISSLISPSAKPEMGMDIDPTNIVVVEGRQSRLRHQPQVESNYKLSKLILGAQRLLLTAFEEIMTFKEEKSEDKPKMKRKLKECIDKFSKSHCSTTEMRLRFALTIYSDSLQKYLSDDVKLAIPEGPLGFEKWTLEALNVLTGVVCAALNSTWSVRSSMNFDAIILNYKTFKILYSRYSEFWKLNNEEEIKDGESRDRVITLKEMMLELLLKMRIVFNMFLMHIGEHAPKKIIDKYVEKLCMEDKKFLRIKICEV